MEQVHSQEVRRRSTSARERGDGYRVEGESEEGEGWVQGSSPEAEEEEDGEREGERREVGSDWWGQGGGGVGEFLIS